MSQERRHDLELRRLVERVERRIERRITRRRTRLEIGRIAVLVLFVASVWLASYQGRAQLVRAQRAACERAKLDNIANAQGWRAAEHARRKTASDRKVAGSERQTAARTAARYERIASGLEARSRIDCAAAFPSARRLPL